MNLSPGGGHFRKIAHCSNKHRYAETHRRAETPTVINTSRFTADRGRPRQLGENGAGLKQVCVRAWVCTWPRWPVCSGWARTSKLTTRVDAFPLRRAWEAPVFITPKSTHNGRRPKQSSKVRLLKTSVRGFANLKRVRERIQSPLLFISRLRVIKKKVYKSRSPEYADLSLGLLTPEVHFMGIRFKDLPDHGAWMAFLPSQEARSPREPGMGFSDSKGLL